MKKFLHWLSPKLVMGLPWLWCLIAKVLSLPPVRSWLIHRAVKTPFTHIMSANGKEVYMERYWLFNPYLTASQQRDTQFPVSIRLHCIRQKDLDRHQHDHPWDARFILLQNGYCSMAGKHYHCFEAGDTGVLRFGKDFHRIEFLSDDYVWTMFITCKYGGTWGFDVDGVKVPHKEYLK